MKLIVAVTVFFLPTALQAAPVHLECLMKSGSSADAKEFLWNVTLNEEAGTVDYEIPENKVALKKPAIFTANSVKFGGMEISRTDLTFLRHDSFGNGAPDEGKCKLAPKKARAF